VRDWWSAKRTNEDASGADRRGSIFIWVGCRKACRCIVPLVAWLEEIYQKIKLVGDCYLEGAGARATAESFTALPRYVRPRT
jgi:hypothetical protein